MCKSCKGCIFNMGYVSGNDRIYCDYIEDDMSIYTGCEFYEEGKNNGTEGIRREMR